jgi:hypothetical protein
MAAIAIAMMAAIGGSPASADTLRDAFAQVYASNPTLTGTRAGLRATDEDVVIARAKGLPDLSATGSYNEFLKRSANSFTAPKKSVGGGFDLTVPLYQGGGVRNSVRAADARVLAGRAGLQGTESDIFTATVAVYMDVIRDTAIVDLNGGNVRVLETNLQASKDRFQLGDLTRTDVAQSEARLALAKSQLEAAQAQLDASRQEYMRIVGKFPDNLAPPPPLPALPASPDDAVDVAVANNPRRSSPAALPIMISVPRGRSVCRAFRPLAVVTMSIIAAHWVARRRHNSSKGTRLPPSACREAYPFSRVASWARACGRRRRARARRSNRRPRSSGRSSPKPAPPFRAIRPRSA